MLANLHTARTGGAYPLEVMLLAATLLLLPAEDPAEDPAWVAHRGASWIAPENTLSAVRAALVHAPEFIEIDVHRTRDGALVVLHDQDLARTTGRAGRVAELEWEAVRGADAGYAERFGKAYAGEPVPLLEEVLDAVEDTATGVMIEVKAQGAGGPAARLVAARGEEARHVLASFHIDVVVDASLAAPDLRTLYLVSDPGPEHVELARRCGAAILGVGHRAADAKLRAATTRAGLELWTWTVDDPLRVDALRALRVDGVISNRVALVRPGRLANGVTAHRGDSLAHPENTVPALRAGIVQGADWLELDVYRCASGELVVTHDPSTLRVAGVDLAVGEASYADLAALDVAAGFRSERGLSLAEVPPAHMPTLAEVLELVRTQDRTHVSIQPKNDCVDACVALVRRLGVEAWVGFNDGDLAKMRRVKQLAPELHVFWDVDATPEHVEVARSLGFEAMVMPHAAVTAEKCARLRALGIEPGAWTVNDPARMAALLDLGVERIYTDGPAVLLRLRTLRARSW